ncbi:MAG: hypothetical protein JOZ27_09120 [Caulobacteraceae bacterium]|nr:hypothetical protein [Caulobacteraceae bacterium]
MLFLSVASTVAFLAADLARWVMRVWTLVFTMIGAAFVSTIVWWDRLGGMGGSTVNDAVHAAQRDGGRTLNLLCWFASGLLILLSPYRRSPVRNSLARTAREEAKHALVGCVLGLPVQAATVFLFRTSSGCRGAVSVRPPPEEWSFRGSHVRMMAAVVSGHVRPGKKADPVDVLDAMKGTGDWQKVEQIAWSAAIERPGTDLFAEVAQTVVEDMAEPRWRTALKEAATLLVRRTGRPVHAEEFQQIAARHGLSMPRTESLIERQYAS